MNVMERLNGSAAGEVFRFFGEICRIPHGSGNVGAISAYLADFAKERGLTCVQDPVNNIIIIKEAAAGYEEEEPLLLQGHMDMVAVKKPGTGCRRRGPVWAETTVSQWPICSRCWIRTGSRIPGSRR